MSGGYVYGLLSLVFPLPPVFALRSSLALSARSSAAHVFDHWIHWVPRIYQWLFHEHLLLSVHTWLWYSVQQPGMEMGVFLCHFSSGFLSRSLVFFGASCLFSVYKLLHVHDGDIQIFELAALEAVVSLPFLCASSWMLIIMIRIQPVS